MRNTKLSLRSRLKILATGNLDEYRESWLRGDDPPSSGNIDTDRAMKYSVVNACVRVRAETFASVPIMIYRKTKDGREPITDISLYDILHHRPNGEMAPFGFKETLMTNFDVSGNTVCERLYNKTGELIGLYPYPHEAVTIGRDKATNKLIYKIGSGEKSKILQREEVLHVPNMSFDGVIGMSPIGYAASAIRLGLSYENYGVKFYENAATPSGVFEHPSKLSDTGYERLKSDLKTNYTGMRNAGVPMILEEGMKWHQVTISPIDAQLLESKNFQIEDVCRIYRVPQHLVNKLDRSTYTNIEHQSLEFVMYTMLPIFKRYEDCINSQLITPQQRKSGVYCEFKIDGLLRGDQKSRAEAYATGRQWGWLSVNDIRKLENLPSIGAQGDIYLTPVNMIDSSKMDQQVSAQNNAKLIQDIADMIKERG